MSATTNSFNHALSLPVHVYRKCILTRQMLITSWGEPERGELVILIVIHDLGITFTILCTDSNITEIVAAKSLMPEG